jgi:hypothetical protein
MPRKLVLLLGLIAATAAIALACSDSDDGTAAAGADHAHTDNVGLLAALSTLADGNLHHVETTLIGDDAEIDPTWIAPLLNARTATAIVTWPEELQEASENFLADSMPLLMALQADDLEAAAAAAPKAHASWHLLRDPGYAYLAEAAGTGAMGDDGHAHEDGEDGDHEDGDDDE